MTSLFSKKKGDISQTSTIYHKKNAPYNRNFFAVGFHFFFKVASLNGTVRQGSKAENNVGFEKQGRTEYKEKCCADYN